MSAHDPDAILPPSARRPPIAPAPPEAVPPGPRPLALYTIVALNVLVFAAVVAAGVSPLSPTGRDLVRFGASFGPLTVGGQPWRLLTSTFLHFGLLHIGMNMYVLWGAGGFVERLFGHGRFAAIYLAAGLVGAAASLLVHPLGASAGASGAVFGVY